MNHSKCKI